MAGSHPLVIAIAGPNGAEKARAPVHGSRPLASGALVVEGPAPAMDRAILERTGHRRGHRKGVPSEAAMDSRCSENIDVEVTQIAWQNTEELSTATKRPRRKKATN